jgi:hypothetical protein
LFLLTRDVAPDGESCQFAFSFINGEGFKDGHKTRSAASFISGLAPWTYRNVIERSPYARRPNCRFHAAG